MKLPLLHNMKLFKKHGVNTIRNFDALNDVNNIIYSANAIKNNGMNHEVTITMMELPPGCVGAHTAEFYIDRLRQILDSGLPFDRLAFKDASGTSSPNKVYETIKQARALLGNDIPIRFHSHETAGVSVIAYKAALDAGADGLDLAMAPLSGGTCQPDHITMWHALKGTDYDLGYDIDKLIEAENVLKEVLKDYFMPPEATTVNPMIVFSPLPGGALTANTQMMRDNGVLDKYNDVVKAMREVVEKGGYGTSVTPVSQFYFQQAFNNVMFGPWNKIAEGYGKMVLGYFGKTPCEPDSEVVKIASEQLHLEPTTKTPLQINDENPNVGVEASKKRLVDNNIEVNDENIFISAACEDKGILFLEGKAHIGVRKNCGENKETTSITKSDAYCVKVNGKNFNIKFENDNKATVNGKTYDIDIKEGVKTPSSLNNTGEVKEVKAALPGNVLRIEANVGDTVNENDVLLVVEAMKMETEIKSPFSGVVKSILVEQGDQIQTGQVLFEVE